MADSQPTQPAGPTAAREQIASAVGRLGLLTTLLSALVLVAVLVGNLFVLVFKVPVSPWLLVIVEVGPVLGVFFANIGTGVNYYGAWRVLRGLDQYDVKSDAKNQAQAVPGMLQWVPQALVGCLPVASAVLLGASLIVSLLTLAPAPIHTLGVTLSPSGSSTGNSSGTSSRGTTTKSPTPAHVQFAVLVGSNGTSTQQCGTASTILPSVVVTLDNSGSNVDVRWELTHIDTLDGTTPPAPWASASAATGTVGAGKTDTLTLTPAAQICAVIPQAGNTYRALVQAVGGNVYSIADQVGAPPHLALSLSATALSQTCPSFYSALPAVKVTLDNSASNVPATWQLNGMQKIPGTPHEWATASATSGTVAAGQSATLSLTPHPKLCYWNPLPSKVYHVTLQWNGGQTATITDAITSPVPPPPPPPPVMWLGISPLDATQSCASLGAYPVTLVNSGSYAVDWAFTATDPVSATNSAPWASASPTSGTVPAGGTAQFTVTPNVGICAIAGTPTYHATFTQSGNSQQGPTQTLTDQIGVGAQLSFGVHPTSNSQTCGGSSLAYAVTLDNSGSTIPVTWSFSAPGGPGGKAWATASPADPTAGTTIGAGQTESVKVTPDANVCAVVGSTPYTGTFTAKSADGKTATASITDTISVGASVGLSVDHPNETQSCAGLSLGSYQITLTNTGNVAVGWSFSATEQVSGTPWASAAPSSGTVAVGGQQTVKITPVASICAAGGTTPVYHATISPSGGAAFTPIPLSDTITVPNSVTLVVTPASNKQSCSDGSIGTYQVTIDNTKSNTPIAWAFTASDTTPDGNAWATASNADSSTSHIIGAGQKKIIVIAPSADVCSVGGTTTYHATISATSPDGATPYGSAGITDTITVPVSVTLSVTPASNRQMCSDGSIGTYQVTIDNTKSNAPIVWAFTASDTTPNGNAWASASNVDQSKSHIIGAGQKKIIVIMPSADVCSVGGTTTYHATISATSPDGATPYGSAGITDTITVESDRALIHMA